MSIREPNEENEPLNESFERYFRILEYAININNKKLFDKYLLDCKQRFKKLTGNENILYKQWDFCLIYAIYLAKWNDKSDSSHNIDTLFECSETLAQEYAKIVKPSGNDHHIHSLLEFKCFHGHVLISFNGNI